ncbi:MAG: GIY-YIG nuclease family protein [Lactobacillales bacterium]|jgi:putative endonuclease|nr:GIY-YIG nuclease family protein [Lactobacillales bacterium]
MGESKQYFYVLHTKDDTFYGGYTTDPVRRLKEHNDGVGAKYTRLPKRRPLHMIHLEEFSTRSDATKAEASFKKLSRTQKENYLTTHRATAQKLLTKLFKENEHVSDKRKTT